MGSSSRNKQSIFDEIRRCFVAATPEELVRQFWIQKMIYQLGYPRELIAVEKALGELPHLSHSSVPERRLDILCYGKESSPPHSLFPLLLMECKHKHLSEDALNQVMGYNYHVKAPFIAACSQNEVRFGSLDPKTSKYVFCTFIPLFKELMEWVKR